MALNPGERVLDIGAGTGHFLADMAHATAGKNEIVGLDISEDMLARARQRCGQDDSVSFQTGDLYSLPFSDNSFDAAVSVQVFEYLEDVPQALAEIRRILRPGGRVAIRDTDWQTCLWHAEDISRMKRMLEVWDLHLVDPFLPRTLAKKMTDAGFREPKILGMMSCETSFDDTSSSYHIAKFVSGYAVSQGIEASVAQAWLVDLQQRHDEGSYFYSLGAHVFLASVA